jgi:transmembrane sensor
MERSRPEYLIDKLLSNELSKEEFDELLAGLGENEMSPTYSTILEAHFNNLLAEHEQKSVEAQLKD